MGSHIPSPPFDRLWNRVTETDAGCWEWAGKVNGQGYGLISSGPRDARRYLRVHRVSYEGLVGPIPDGLELDHLCRNPPCLNPAHLEPVTHRVNMARSSALSAVTSRTGICQRGHKMTPDNLYIRPDGTKKLCRACVQIRSKRRPKGSRMRPHEEVPC